MDYYSIINIAWYKNILIIFECLNNSCNLQFHKTTDFLGINLLSSINPFENGKAALGVL